jgi:hypothetical protein
MGGRISAVLVIIGVESMLSCLVGARLILTAYMICCSILASIDNFAYFLLNPVIQDNNTVKHELS